LQRAANQQEGFLRFIGKIKEGPDRTLRDTLEETWTRVQLIGSQEAVDDGSGVYRQSSGLWFEMVRSSTARETDTDRADALLERSDAVDRLLAPYRNSARRNIGTLV
jgi:hypothetical protein